MPMIRVEMLPGRSLDQKRALTRELTDAFIRTAGGNPAGVHVVLTEVAGEDWAVGGELISDRLPGT